MTEKELKKLNRAELLELLLEQTQEADRLRKRLEQAEAALADRQIKIENAGDLAQAVLAVNGVMEAAQAAAKQYLENIQFMEAQAKKKCVHMMQAAQRKSVQERNAQLSHETDMNQENDFLAEIYELLK